MVRVCVQQGSWQRNRTAGASAVESVGTEACIGSKKLWVAIDSSLATAQPASSEETPAHAASRGADERLAIDFVACAGQQ